MLLSTRLQAFVQESPVSVMVQGTLERLYDPDRLEGVFADAALRAYTKDLTFAQCVHLMSDVVFRVCTSVGAYFQDKRTHLDVTRDAVYQKLRRMELPVGAALVRDSAAQLLPVLQALPDPPPPPLPGYRLVVLDGNHLTGTEHRLEELRPYRAAALPGQALVLYDPRWDLITEVVPCADAYAQERSLLPALLARLRAGDCVLADRNFCTTGFVFGLRRLGARFVIRQHSSTLTWELKGQRRYAGKDQRGRALYEQAIALTDPDSEETMVVRRITIVLDRPTAKGETEIHILTDLPAEVADARRVAQLYADRWSIEGAFQRLAEDLRSEIDTLAYPPAALFGFAVAAVAYNTVALVKGALRAVWGEDFLKDKLSTYYLTLEVARVTPGLRIAAGPRAWAVFRTMSTAEFAATLVALAGQLDEGKFTKHKRGPKKKPPKKISGKRHHHVSTARLLAGRARK
jgi:Transposase DDE domain